MNLYEELYLQQNIFNEIYNMLKFTVVLLVLIALPSIKNDFDNWINN
jgi:hypothetical protein